MSTGFLALVILGGLAALIIYGQIGWLLVTHWDRTMPDAWDEVVKVLGAVVWPICALFIYAIIPFFLALIRLITAPQRRMEARRERRERQDHEEALWRRQAELEAGKAVAEAAASPAGKISSINDELVRMDARRAELLAQKAELERRPDAARA